MASSRNERSVLVYTGLAFALINILTAWVLIAHRSWALGRLLTPVPTSASVEASSEQDVRDELLREVPTVLRTFQNGFYIHYNMDLIALAVAFCFFGVGFSLVIMGKNAAIEARAGGTDIGWLMLKTTSPGLFCFVMATVVVGFTLWRGGFLPDGMFGNSAATPSETNRERAEVELLRAQASSLRAETLRPAPMIDYDESARNQAEAAWYQAKTRAMERLLRDDLPPTERSAILQALLGVTPASNGRALTETAESATDPRP